MLRQEEKSEGDGSGKRKRERTEEKVGGGGKIRVVLKEGISVMKGKVELERIRV